jgi:hypothetical protein
VFLLECFNRHQVHEGVLSASSRSVYGIGSLDPSSIFNCVFPWDISILIGEPVLNHPLSTGRKDGGSDPKPAGLENCFEPMPSSPFLARLSPLMLRLRFHVSSSPSFLRVYRDQQQRIRPICYKTTRRARAIRYRSHWINGSKDPMRLISTV